MDNIKKFEGFLGRMQGLLDSAKKQGHIIVRVEDLENTFPELRESEDEKIRKYLIERIISAYGENSSTPEGIKVKDIIDWLEKQKRLYSDYEESELRRGLLWHLKELQDIKKSKGLHIKSKATYESWITWLEKQGEPADINPSEFDLRLNKLLKQFKTLPKEELVSSLSFYLNVVQNDGTYKADEKKGEQKPAEWSEEDEKCIKLSTDIIDSALRAGFCVQLDRDRCVDWLKSLRPQKQWKPTEAQLASLTIACDRNDRIGFDLTQLLKELKKL